MATVSESNAWRCSTGRCCASWSRCPSNTSRSRTSPSARPAQASSRRSSFTQSGSSIGFAACRRARRRRMATRCWCSSSGSLPSRVPGSCCRIARYCASSIAVRCFIGFALRRGGLPSGRTRPSARNSFGRSSASSAPAARSARSIRCSDASSPSTSSTSSSSIRDTRRPLQDTTTSSITTSARSRPLSRTIIPCRVVSSVATGASGRPRVVAASRSPNGGGTDSGEPGSSSSSRSPLRGSFSCQAPEPCSAR